MKPELSMMLNDLNKPYPFNDDLKVNLRSFVGVGLGVFLFFLFFQPFQLKNPDFNNQNLILAGFGAISLVLLCLLRVLLPSVFTKLFAPSKWNYAMELLINLIFAVLNSVAFTFFARYVGQIKITFHIVMVIVLVSLAEMVIVIVINEFRRLNRKVVQLNDLAGLSDTVEIEDGGDVQIEFVSENKSDYFQVFLEQVILIKSASNYIEVIYKMADKISRRLIRNTLKNTEEIFSKYPTLIRCHRSCIVNKNYIQKLQKGNNGLKLVLFDYPKEIHVSRQYALKVKEALKQGD
jgi:DNA-binding LytR/AlgR family response regulator